MLNKNVSFLFLLLFAFCSGSIWSQNIPAGNTVQQQLDSLTHCSFFDTANVAVTVFDPVKGKMVYSFNENKLFHPASNMKIFTSAAALQYLGPQYSIVTGIYANADINDGTLNGDLWIKGAADPDFTTDDLDTIAAALKSLGIRRISGSVKGDISLFDTVYWGKGWMWDDASSTDAPFITPLPINKNSVTLFSWVKEGKVIDSIAPACPYFTIQNTLMIDSTGRSRVHFENNFPLSSSLLKIYGRINPADTVSETINVPDPGTYFLALCKHRLSLAGVTVEGSMQFGNIPANARLLCSVKRTLAEVLIDLNKQSRNLSAELVMRMTARYFKPGNISDNDGLLMIDSLILASGKRAADYRLADGSGISRYNLVSTSLIVSVLRFLFYQNQPAYHALRDAFPVIGIDGTLRKRMRNTELQGNVYAKTGTLSGVSCLSGYVHTSQGTPVIFAIMMQNHVGMLNRCYQIQHEILQVISSENRW